MTIKRGGVMALHSKEEVEEKRIRYCTRCEELFGVEARLGPRIMPLDEATGKPIPKPTDYELWLECRNCGTVYAKHETKAEPVLDSVIKAKDNPFDKGKIKGVEKRKKISKRGNNPRVKQHEDMKDEDLQRDLKSGSILVSYSSSEPFV